MNKKICLVVRSLKCGGAERVISELANYFSVEKQSEVHIIVFSPGEIFYPLSDSIEVHFPENELKGNRFLYALKVLLFIRKTVLKINPDSILSLGEIWNSFLLFAIVGLKTPVFLSDRSQPNKDLGIVQNLLRKYLYRYATGLICQTEKALEITRSRTNHPNIITIGNPIRMISYEDSSLRKKQIVSVGRLIETKHFDELIKLFLSLNIPDWRLVIVGGDAKKQNNFAKLKMIVDQNNAAQKVILTGYQKDVDRYLLESSIFAFTSSSEGFPNVVGEAMSAGLPVVSFDCVAGPSDMIEEGKTGFLVPLYDYHMFSKKLSLLMLDDKLRGEMSTNSIDSIKMFNSDVICEQYYQFILSEKKSK